MNSLKLTKIAFITLTIAISAATRFIPHPPNFTPILSMALIGGAFINDKRLAFLIPILAMFVSDAFLGFHATMVSVYFCFILTVALGFFIKDSNSPIKVAGFSLVSSVMFYLITNLAHFILMSDYSKDYVGLITCFSSAIPFFKYTLLSGLIYSLALFYSITLFEKYAEPKLILIKINK